MKKKHLIRKKSIYNRKYHLQNKILDIICTKNIQISHKQQKQILDVFEKIDKVLLLVHCKGRKRLIKIDFILNKLFDKLKIPIKLGQKDSKQISLFYKQYWNKINSLCGEEIQSILDR